MIEKKNTPDAVIPFNQPTKESAINIHPFIYLNFFEKENVIFNIYFI